MPVHPFRPVTAAPSRSRRRSLLALVAGAVLVLAACSDGSDDTTDADPPESSAAEQSSSPDDAATEAEWADVDAAVAALAPEVGMLVAEVSADGTCEPIHEVASATARPTASQFKLFVLGALSQQIADGTLSWDQTLTVDEDVKSVGNSEGSLQFVEAGTEVTVEEAATKMISISDNTATDLLIGLVGREAVEEQMAEWTADPSANVPFLTTQQMFLLHYAEGLGEQYLATPPEERAAFLASSVDPLPITAIGTAYTDQPAFVEEIEWFASPTDVCQAFAGLQTLAEDPALSEQLPGVLSVEDGTIDLDPSTWPTVWYKGGSEAGVLTLGWLATADDGRTFVVETMLTNPDDPLADDSITDLVAISRDAFALLPPG